MAEPLVLRINRFRGSQVWPAGCLRVRPIGQCPEQAMGNCSEEKSHVEKFGTSAGSSGSGISIAIGGDASRTRTFNRTRRACHGTCHSLRQAERFVGLLDNFASQ